MANKGTVGVTFKLIDKASAVFENIALKGKKTQEQIEHIGQVSQKMNSKMKSFATSTSNAMRKVHTSIKNASDKIGYFMTRSTIAVAGLTAGLMKCVSAAADIQATSAQFEQVFGKLSGSAQKGLDEIADKTGVVSNRLKSYYTQLAAFSKSTGMSDEGAMDVAQRATLAATDLSAFWDRDLAEVVESVQSYLKGNFENDAALGFSSTEATRNAMAAKLYGKKYIDLTEQEKQLTLLSQIEEASKLTGAEGQASREADSYLNQMGNVKQTWLDIQAIVGEAFLPATIEASQEISNFLKENKEDIREFANKLADVIVPAIKWTVTHLDTIIKIGKAVGAVWIGGKAFGFLTPLITGAGKLIPMLGKIFNWAKKISIFGGGGGLGVGTAKLAKGVSSAGKAGLAAGAGTTAGGIAAAGAFPTAVIGAGFLGTKALGKAYGWDVDFSNKDKNIDYMGSVGRSGRMGAHTPKHLQTTKDNKAGNNTSVVINVKGNMISNKQYAEEMGRYISKKLKAAFANAK